MGVGVAITFGGHFFAEAKRGKVLGLVSPVAEITASPSMTLIPTASPSATPAATPSAVLTIKITPNPTKKPTLKVTAVPTPTAETSGEVNELINRFSAQYGVDPNVIRHIAICESGFRSNAKHGPYIGLFQFGETTWINIRKEMGEETNSDLRYSAEESVQTVAYAVSKGKGGIWPNCMP